MTHHDNSKSCQSSIQQTTPFQEGKVNKGGKNPPRPTELYKEPPIPAPMSPQPSNVKVVNDNISQDIQPLLQHATPFQEGKVNKGGKNPPRPAELYKEPPIPAPMSPQPSNVKVGNGNISQNSDN